MPNIESMTGASSSRNMERVWKTTFHDTSNIHPEKME